MRRGSPRLSGWIPAAVLCAAAAARANGPIGDAPVFARIEALRPVAAAIAIDGDGSDWGAIPELPDPAGDASGDLSRDIAGVSIAPLDDALLVRIRTAGAPSTDDLAFWLYVDFMGQQFLDLEIGLYLGFDDILWTYPATGPATFQYWSDSTTVIGNVVEVRIPYAQLATALPADMADALSGSDARSFVRVTPFTRDYTQPGVPIVDYGAAVASFRLVPTPYALDTALPAAGTPVAVEPALDGLWYVDQGGFGLGTHAGYWGYDFSIVDNALHPDVPYLSANLADYPSFGQTVRASRAGTVISTAGANPDLPPRSGVSGTANFVYLDGGDDVALLFTHLKQGSLAVTPGQPVAAGAVLGEVGHSGSGSWPHLHLGAAQLPAGTVTLPLAYTKVEVGLNPVASDPWRRWLPLWALREGYTVERAGALCGDVAVNERLDDADVAAFRALLANPGGAPLTLEGARRCNVIAPVAACSVRDLVVLRRALASPGQLPGVAEVCPAALGT